MPKQYVLFEEAEALHDTDDGLKVSVGGGEPFWIPKSAIHDDSETYKKGTSGNLIIAKWLADKNKLEGEDYGL